MEIYSVSEITKYIKLQMDDDSRLSRVMVRGELSNYKCYTSGHCYFTLKDKTAAIRCVMFKSRAQFLKFKPTDGMKIAAGGRITVFERDGQYQLYAEMLMPEGAGELSIAFEQLKARLSAEGLFEAIHKKQLPSFPKKIGIVTSLSGAVLRDIKKVAKRRNPDVELVLCPVLVQGSGSAEQIAAAIDLFNERYPVDVLIVGRGGGSIEDLWSFNDEAVVRAVYRSEIPVISAVGHQTDFTLCDFVSDVRAATPSHAAELAVPDMNELAQRLGLQQRRLENAVRMILQEKRTTLRRLAENRYLIKPELLLEKRYQQLDTLQERLDVLCQNIMLGKQNQLQQLAAKLEALSPLAVLARGYGVIKKADGNSVKAVTELQSGQPITVIMQDGSVEATVDKVKKAGK